MSVLAICALMFIVKRQTKVGLLLLTAMLFSLVKVPFIPFGSNSILLVSICMIFSELPRLVRYFKLFARTPIGKLLLLVLAGGMVCCIFSPHLRTFSELKSFFLAEYMIKYFALAYSFCLIRRPTDLKPALRVLFYGLIVMTFFAIMNVIAGSSFFVKELMGDVDITNKMTSDAIEGDFHSVERFRVQATFMFPFDYGYICCIALALMSFGYKAEMIDKMRYFISLFCCVFGIFSCGCRTVLFCALIGTICFLWLTTPPKKFLRILSISCIFALLLLCIPFVRNKASVMMTMFSTDSEVEGSSLTMRIDQYSAVLDYLDGKQIFFGNGYNFFNIDLGWGDNEDSFMDKELEGLEGVLMNLALERGIVGIVVHMAFYLSLLLLVIRNRRYSRSLAALGVSVLVVYLLFANMTGELSSVYPTLIVSGYVLKSELFVKRRKCIRKSVSQ